MTEGADLSPFFLERLRVEDHPARDLMVTSVITASPYTDVRELADLLTRKHIERLPILRDGAVVGIVSRADLVEAMARTPSRKPFEPRIVGRGQAGRQHCRLYVRTAPAFEDAAWGPLCAGSITISSRYADPVRYGCHLRLPGSKDAN
jgi:hypothetical protein